AYLIGIDSLNLTLSIFTYCKSGMLPDLGRTIYSFITKFKNGDSLSFDVIPVDDEFAQLDEDKIRSHIKPDILRRKLAALKSEYDYIFIDAPPNWRFYSIYALNAADVVLIPTRHNNVRSLQNAAITISQYIPEIQHNRQKKKSGIRIGSDRLTYFL
ncbi:MAG: ParA family protein, partial [Cyanobacteria bacterium J06623_7]